MNSSQVPYYELYEAILNYAGQDVFGEVLQLWVSEHACGGQLKLHSLVTTAQAAEDVLRKFESMGDARAHRCAIDGTNLC